MRTSRYLAVNRSGARLWPMLVEGASRAKLVERLVADYGIAAHEATADVVAFLDALDEQGLLEAAPGSAAD